MPIYEYECGKCKEVFEVMQKISDPAPKKHSCGSTRVKRVMSRSSFILKGSGWYVTDYARKGKDSSTGSDSTSDSKKKDKTDKKAKKDGEKSKKKDAKAKSAA